MRLTVRLMAAVLLITPALAETITKKDRTSVNGKLTRFADGGIDLVARYDSGDKTISIKLSDISVIEFNATTFNAGAPPKSLGLGPSSSVSPAAEPNQSDAVNSIVLRGGQIRSCRLIGIDDQSIHCMGKDGDYPRRIVIRVFLGGQ